MNTTSKLDPDLSMYYDAMFALFASPGWKYLLEDLDRLTLPLQDVRKIKGEDSLRFIQGQIDIVDWLKEAKARYEVAYSTLTEAK
jgi:hypothetical protein